MSDKELYLQCRKFGAQALEARRKLEGLLPEVYKRRLYEKKGFNSIFEFAAKLAGLNKEQVQRVLQLERKFEDKPILKEALVSGDVSFNKLARVASIATMENQGDLVEKAKVLPKSALETYVRDIKNENTNASIKPIFEVNSVPGHRIELSNEVNQKLCELQEKGIDINQLLLELLQKREEEITEEKEKLAQEEMHGNTANRQTDKKSSRYINVRIKKVLRNEHGSKCSIPSCNKPSKIIHHTQRFALSHTHDPRYLAPLCKEHHQIAHLVDLKYQEKRPLVCGCAPSLGSYASLKTT